MANYFMIFDYKNNRIGWLPSKDCDMKTKAIYKQAKGSK